MRHLDNDVKCADDIRQQDQKRGFREKGRGMWMREMKYADKSETGPHVRRGKTRKATWDEIARFEMEWSKNNPYETSRD